MYDKKLEKVEKASKKIVENINDMAKATKERKGKGYLTKAKGTVKMPEVDSDVGINLGKYIDKQVKEAKSSSKKVGVDIE